MRSRFGRGAQGQSSRERGATLAEYALVFALLIVGSLGAIQFLTENAEEQINNNADCVSKRPPPVECQTPAQPVPTNYNNFPPTTPPYTPPSAGSGQIQSPTWSSSTKKVSGTARITSGSSGVSGATVYLKVTCNGTTFYTTVTTNGSGNATFSFGNCSGPGTAAISIYRVDSAYNVTVPVNANVTMT